VDNGRLVVGNRVEMGYLEQTAVSGSDRTVWEEARSRMTELIEAEAAIDAASQAASLGTLQHSPLGLVTAFGTQQCRCSPPAYIAGLPHSKHNTFAFKMQTILI